VSTTPHLPGLRPGSAAEDVSGLEQRLLKSSVDQSQLCWRDLLAERGIKVHPAAELFPMMADDELDVLAKDIDENRLRHGVTLWTPERAGKRKGLREVYLLDGRNRLEAIWRSNRDLDDRYTAIEDALDFKYGAARLIYAEFEDPWTYVISANAHRRHLTREQKRDLIEKLLKVQPEKSDRQIAATVKASHHTVATRRELAEARGQIAHVETRIDSKGRQQPARKLGTHSRTMVPDELAQFRAERPAEPETPEPIETVGDRKDAFRVFDDAVDFVMQRHVEVKAMPMWQRVQRVRRAMDALGVGDKDLIPGGAR